MEEFIDVERMTILLKVLTYAIWCIVGIMMLPLVLGLIAEIRDEIQQKKRNK